MEQQLSDNEKLLRTIAENVPRAYLSVINPDLTIGFTNGQEFKRHRLNPEIFIGRHIRDVFGVYGQDVLETIITAYRQTFAGQEQSFELFIAGEYQSYMTVPLLNEHGDISQILAVVQNINERKQAEEALRESETRFRATFEQAAVGLAHVRPDGRWLRVNQKLCEIVGYPQEELFERTFQDITHPDDLDTDLEKMRQILAGQIQTYSLEKRYLRQDRSIVWITLTVSLVRQSSGEPDYFISVVQDITQRKNLEEQYHQAQKMEAIGQLTAGIAHDFNNLLTAINGFAGLMQLELSPDDPHQDSLAKILHSGQRAAELVRQLLAFSRKQVIQPRIINLNTAVAEIDKMLRRIIGENIKLEIRLAPDLGEVKVDPTQLEQVIVNLAVNARDAMPAGGRLIIETSNVLLADQYLSHRLDTQSGEHVLLAISDTGHGMIEEVKAHIFEPFFTTKEQGKGTGLGLATVYGIIKQNGGQIWVYSEPGLGTTFKIYLPCVNVRLYG
jgi:PAS domain S-box-containing protein